MCKVAPLVGAWIEKCETKMTYYAFLSLPSWERGLKRLKRKMEDVGRTVAPLVGAWIEIRVKGVG